ncbi:MAG: acyl carrier protein [Bdellovibrionaceae bacterium]|nr:acyl carrier protein [Pseudobdellovibrionaceae bacterium]
MATNLDIRFFLLNDPMYASSISEEITDDFGLIESGVLDSIGIFNLVAHLEKTYNISIEASDLVESNFRSINAITSFVKARQK